MVKINSKLIKLGNGYAFLVPKALVSCDVLQERKRYKIQVESDDSGYTAGLLFSFIHETNSTRVKINA